MPVKVIPNYVEPCVCGCTLDEIRQNIVWRIVTWTCPACGRKLASTCISDSPVRGAYALRTLYAQSNKLLREEKHLPAKPTRFRFYDEQDHPVLWKTIVQQNKQWEASMPDIQRKPF